MFYSSEDEAKASKVYYYSWPRLGRLERGERETVIGNIKVKSPKVRYLESSSTSIKMFLYHQGTNFYFQHKCKLLSNVQFKVGAYIFTN